MGIILRWWREAFPPEKSITAFRQLLAAPDDAAMAQYRRGTVTRYPEPDKDRLKLEAKR